MQMQATSAKKTNLKDFVGKNVFDVIVELPRMNWTFDDKKEVVDTSIRRLTFVDYEKKKPRTSEDLYEPVDAEGLSMDVLRSHHVITAGKDRIIGLISKVELGPPYEEFEHKFAHIPLLDLDKPEKSLDGKNFLEVVKDNIKKKLELTGLILRSSSKGNLHFIGIGKLFGEEDFITFCGLSLGMKYKTAEGENINLADSRPIGHSLSQMKYMAELNPGGSPYLFGGRFATLRITPKKENEEPPTVVDVVD